MRKRMLTNIKRGLALVLSVVMLGTAMQGPTVATKAEDSNKTITASGSALTGGTGGGENSTSGTPQVTPLGTAEQKDTVLEGYIEEYFDLGEVETSAMPMGFFGLSDGKVALKSGTAINWIDRLDLDDAQVIKNLYNTLVEASNNDGTNDYLIDDSYFESADGNVITVATVTGALDGTYLKEEAETAVSEVASGIFANYSPYMRAAYDAFDRDHPEVFWLSGSTQGACSSGYSMTGTGEAGLYTVEYTVTVQFVLKGSNFDIRATGYQSQTAIEGAITTVNNRVSALVTEANKKSTAADKIAYFNEQLTTTNEYNTSTDLNNIGHDCRECTSALTGKTGTAGPVCEAYARAFKVLCDKAGIPCVLVDGQAKNSAASDGEAHMWNYVQVEDEWLAVDVTWNDPKGGTSGAVSGAENEKWLLVYANNVIADGMTFLESHPVANQVSTNGVGFTNGPELAEATNIVADGKVATEAEFYAALADSSIEVIELTQDISLSWNELSGDNAFVINRPVTITGGTLGLPHAGIILGADVTFENISLSINNPVRNAIIANGYSLTINNVSNANKKQDGTINYTIDLFCGGITDYNGGNASEIPAVGSNGSITMKGTNTVGTNIFAGSLSDIGHADATGTVYEDVPNTYTGNATITLEQGASGFSNIYAHGAREDRSGGHANEWLADATKYTVTGDVKISLQTLTSSLTVDGATGGTANATFTYQNTSKGDVCEPTLSNIGSILLLDSDGSGEIAYLAPKTTQTSFNTLSVPANTRLSFVNMGNEISAISFVGGGELVFAKKAEDSVVYQKLTLNAATGTTKVAVGGVDYTGTGSTGTVDEGWTCITVGSTTSEYEFVLMPNSSSPNIALENDGNGNWITAGTESLVKLQAVAIEESIKEAEGVEQIAIPVKVTYATEDENNSIGDIPMVITVNGKATTVEEVWNGYNYSTGTTVSDILLWFGFDSDIEAEALYIDNAATTNETYYAISTGTYNISLAIPAKHMADGEAETISFVLTVGTVKPDPTYTVPTNLTATYGQTLGDVVLSTATGDTPGTWSWDDEASTLVGGVGTNTFTATFTPADTNNYNTKSGIVLTISVSPLDITNLEGVSVGSFDSLTYSGQAQTPVAAVTIPGNTEDEAITVTGTWSEVTNCSDTSTFTANGNFTGSLPGRATGMAPKSVAPVIIGVEGTYGYTGSAIVPEITVTEEDGTIIPVEAYTVNYSNNTEVGTATVTVSAKAGGNYSFTEISKNFTIKKYTVIQRGAENLTITDIDDVALDLSAVELKHGDSFSFRVVLDWGYEICEVQRMVYDTEGEAQYEMLAADSTGTYTISNITSDVELYITLTSKVYPITYYVSVNGGEYEEVAPEGSVFSFGVTGPSQIILPAYEENDALFDGWYTDADCTGEKITFYTLTMDDVLKEGRSFYAKQTTACIVALEASQAGSLTALVEETPLVSGESLVDVGSQVTVIWEIDEAYIADYSLELEVIGDMSGDKVAVTSVTGEAVSDNMLKYTFAMPQESVTIQTVATEQVYGDTESRSEMPAAVVPVIDYINECIVANANLEYSKDVTMNVVWSALTETLTLEPGACLWFRTRGSIVDGVHTIAGTYVEMRIPSRPVFDVSVSTTETTAVIEPVDEKYAGTTKYGVVALSESEEDIIWQASNEFSGLQPSTDYLFYVKIEAKAGEYFARSPVYVTDQTKQAVPTISEVTATGTYGKVLSEMAISGTADFNGIEVPGCFTWETENADDITPNAGTFTEYTVVFTPKESMYQEVTGIPVTLVVNKAAQAPNMPFSTMNVAYEVETVGAVTLPTDWTWEAEDAEKALVVGETTATAIYNGADKGNYEIESVEITITRSACGHSGGTATCKDLAVCTVCGEAYGTVDSNNHIGETEQKNAVEATCIKAGNEAHSYCKDCGAKLAEGEVIPALGHKDADKNHICDNGCDVVQGICADAAGDGNHTCDYGCGKTLTSCSGGIATCKDKAVCEECGASYGDLSTTHNYTGKVTKEPTAEAEGERTYTCGICGHSYTEAIAKLEPTPTPKPTATPTPMPTSTPTPLPTSTPTPVPTSTPTPLPTSTPTPVPTSTPTPVPTSTPTLKPTATPLPTSTPTPAPTVTPKPTVAPTATPKPTVAPTATPKPTEAPTATPKPTSTPTPVPTSTPTPVPTSTPTPVPTSTPTPVPTSAPTPKPTSTPKPTATATPVPTSTPTPLPTSTPTPVPTSTPTPVPTSTPTPMPTSTPTPLPTSTPTPVPTSTPTPTPTATPIPTLSPEWERENYDIFLGTSKKDTPMERKQEIGKTVDLNFYGVKNWAKDKYEYEWTSSDESIAVVDKNGKVTMVGAGIAIIRLEMTEKATGEKLNIAPVEVGVPEEIYEVFLGTSKKETELRRELIPGKKLDFNFYGVKNYKASDYTYKWTSSDETVAIVDKKGVVTALAPGKTVIRLEMVRKATGEKLLIAPIVLTVPDRTEEKGPDEKEKDAKK